MRKNDWENRIEYLYPGDYFLRELIFYMKKDINYFVFEWIDGSGKDTQMMNFASYLREKDKYKNILITREPSNSTKEGRKIAKRLKTGFKSKDEEMNLYINDRIKTHRKYKKIMETDSNITILSSRSELSTYSYQTDEAINYDIISLMSEKLDKRKELIHAGLTFVFTVSPEKTISRIKKRAKWGELDIFETQEFLTQTQDKYLAATFYLSARYNMSFVFVDSNGSVEEVKERMIRHYEEFLSLRKMKKEAKKKKKKGKKKDNTNILNDMVTDTIMNTKRKKAPK